MPSTTTITAIVITFNEERNIRACLESLSWADEIILVDAMSTDATATVAREFSGNVFVRAWEGYGPARNFAIDRATSDWVFILDADERVPEALAGELKVVASAGSGSPDVPAGPAVFDVARRAFFLGRWIRHSGWYPGYVTRFFKRGRARYDEALVHEKLRFTGRRGKLKHSLDHHTDDNLFHYLGKFNRYTTLAATDLHQHGRRISVMQLLVKPAWLFLRMYLFRGGFQDGIQGLLLSLLSASYVFVKYAKLLELSNPREGTPLSR